MFQCQCSTFFFINANLVCFSAKLKISVLDPYKCRGVTPSNQQYNSTFIVVQRVNIHKTQKEFVSWGGSGTGGKEVFSNQKVASSIPCRSVLEQDTGPLIAPDVQCAVSVNVKCVYIVSRTYVSRFG